MTKEIGRGRSGARRIGKSILAVCSCVFYSGVPPNVTKFPRLSTFSRASVSVLQRK